MLTNDSQSIQATAFVEWELDNGILLFEVLAEIDSVWFKLIRSADVGENWVFKVTNFQNAEMMTRYYEEILGIPFDKMPKVNLNEIAKESNAQEIFKLCQLVLFITVERENNAVVVERLQRLTEQSQGVVMNYIEEINGIRLAAAGQSHLQPTTSSSSIIGGNGDYTPRSSFADETMYRNQNELSRMLLEKEDLEASHRKLIEEHARLRYRYDELETEKDDLQLRLQEMDKAVTRANETGRADFIMRTEIEHLKQDLQKSEDRRQEAEMLLEQQTMAIEELTQKGEELKKQVDQSSSLKDKLDECRHASEKLQKAENVIEKYKKKMEDSGDLKRQIKSLDEQNHSLMERNQQIENEYGKVLVFKTLMDSYKDQVAMLETKNNELVREKNKMEYDIQQMTNRVELLEVDKARDSERISNLEDHLDDVQMGGRHIAEGPQQVDGADAMDLDDDDDDTHLGDSLEGSMKESNVAKLKLSKRRLERQLRSLQQESGGADKGQNAIVLQHLLDDANRLKAQFEKNYLEVSQERDILQSDMTRVREGIPSSILDDSKQTLSLRMHIIDLEKESEQLREDRDTLQQKVNESRKMLGNNNAGGDGGIDSLNVPEAFKAQYKDMVEKSRKLEEQSKKQLQDINKLILEKEVLQGRTNDQKELLLEKQQLYSGIKASLAVFETKDDEPLKQQNAVLQQQVIQQEEQLREIKLKWKKTKEFVAQQDKLLQEFKQTGATGNYGEAASSLKSELTLRDDEKERLKKQLHEIRLQSRREQQLMMSAWYDIARRTRKDLAGSKAYSNSWLGQHRNKH
ncbi:unnamed protein product [Absidia cylindrospora]